jgi:homoserine O-succinyltransferase
MPLITANQPTPWTRESDGVFILSAADAERQDIRPLRLLLVDLMPEVVGLQLQLERLLANTPLQIELTIAQPGVGAARGVAPPWEARPEERFDGMVITNAAAGQRALHEVPVWDELRDLLDWSQAHVHASMFLGWSALAALDHYYSVPAVALPAPLVGVYRHRVRRQQSYLLRGFDEIFDFPLSRQQQPDPAWLDSPWLEILAESTDAGPAIVRDRNRRQVFITGVPYYDPTHLMVDRAQVATGDGAGRHLLPPHTWRAHAQVLIGNWLNYYVYQSTPFDLEHITPVILPATGRAPSPVPFRR